MATRIVIGEWRTLPNFHGKYSICTNGDIVRHTKAGKIKPMHPYQKGRGSMVVVPLSDMENRGQFDLARLVWETFYGKIPDGMRVWHKNGLATDNDIRNLTLKTRVKIGRLSGYKTTNSRSIVLVDAEGNVLDYCRSASAASKKYNASIASVLHHCKGKIGIPIFDDKEFAFEDSSKSIRAAISRIRKNQEKAGKL